MRRVDLESPFMPGPMLRLMRRVPFLLALRNRVLTRALGKLAVRPYEGSLERLGSRLGGWIVPTESIRPASVCYLAGLGDDASLDLALAERGCDVVVLDPTPRAVTFAEQAFDGVPNVRFLAVGVWSSSATLPFYAPADPAHVSHSVVNLYGTTKWFEAPFRRLSEIQRELGHDRIDLVKLDIEGAEFEVLDDLIRSEFRPRAICVEFDQPAPLWKVVGQLRELHRAGYTIVATEGWNITLVLQEPARVPQPATRSGTRQA